MLSRMRFDPSNSYLPSEPSFRLDRANDKRLIASTSASPARAPHSACAHVSLIHFHRAGNLVAFWTDHARSQSLQHHVSGFVMNADLLGQIPCGKTALLR